MDAHKDAETPSERFERVMRKAIACGKRARARRMKQASRTDSASAREAYS